jgi:hypothetical protein
MISQNHPNNLYINDPAAGSRSHQLQDHVANASNPSRLAVYDPNVQQQRYFVRSPISFREGRRASDGLMSQGPFQQELYDKIKAHGHVELHDMPDKCKELLTKLEQLSAGNNRSGTPGSFQDVVTVNIC